MSKTLLFMTLALIFQINVSQDVVDEQDELVNYADQDPNQEIESSPGSISDFVSEMDEYNETIGQRYKKIKAQHPYFKRHSIDPNEIILRMPGSLEPFLDYDLGELYSTLQDEMVKISLSKAGRWCFVKLTSTMT